MDFSRTFKAIWWAILILGIGYYMSGRLEQLQAGNPTWFDALAFIAWLALSLGPFFKEMEFLGFKLKQEVRELKQHVSSEVAALRDIVQNNEQRQSLSSTHYIGYPPPTDAQLPNIQEQVRAAVREAVGELAPLQPSPAQPGGGLPPDVVLLASSRIALERVLRDLYRSFASTTISNLVRHEPVTRIVNALIRTEVITPELGHAIREVYSVCSLAMHGEDVSSAKVEFVRNTAPELLNALEALASRYA
jgi:hypothetical protein